MTEERETGLLERLIAGDPAAFRDLVETYKKKAYGLAYQMTKNHADAQDVSQTAFIRAFKSVKSLKPGGSLNGWLYRIIHNVAVDHLRKKTFFPREAAVEALAEYDRSPGPEKEAECSQLGGQVRQALARISERERAVFVLRHYHGLKIREIAASLGITTGSTKSYLFRSIRKLQKELSETGVCSGAGDRS